MNDIIGIILFTAIGWGSGYLTRWFQEVKRMQKSNKLDKKK